MATRTTALRRYASVCGRLLVRLVLALGLLVVVLVLIEAWRPDWILTWAASWSPSCDDVTVGCAELTGRSG
ncbi:MAG TPA: hypothetical protein VFP34_15665 [Microlunatus sp.]|nr:hypothetical protein [Microlunatus sp.]